MHSSITERGFGIASSDTCAPVESALSQPSPHRSIRAQRIPVASGFRPIPRPAFADRIGMQWHDPTGKKKAARWAAWVLYSKLTPVGPVRNSLVAVATSAATATATATVAATT